MTVEVILIILAAHWVADFVCQSDKMAINKSKSNGWLTAHVMVYTAVMFPVAHYLLWPVSSDAAIAWLIVNGVLHWVTDFVTSRINSYLWQNDRRHDFFVMVGFDQLIHYACLFYSTSRILQHVS